MSPLKSSSVPSGAQYWRSLDHLADTPEFRQFMHREFPAGASELLDSDDRRQFLKIMGASMALAGMGLAGCRRWPDEKIAPYANRPVNRDPGVPVHYATCMELAGVAMGLLATTFDGRPTKLEGNPDHPTSRGAADRFAQASVLDLYDPDRSRTVVRDGVESDWPAFERWARDHFQALQDKRGHGLAVLSESTGSPSVLAMKQRFMTAFPNARWHEYEPINNDNVVEGSVLAFGVPYRTHLDLEQAKAVVCLDADLLGAHPDAVSNIRGFARSRCVDDPAHPGMSRLHAFESDYSLTGANADERAALRSNDVAAVAAYLATRVLANEMLRRFEDDQAAGAGLTPRVRAAADAALADLQTHRGAGVIAVGPRQPAGVHLLAHLMNAALGNAGKTVVYTPERDRIRHVESIAALAASQPETLVILGGNPVYDAPADLDFAAFLKRAGTTISLGHYVDETAARCHWHVNRAHYLEAWGDGRSWDGTVSIAQPMLVPLYGGKSVIELLATLAGDDVTSGQEIVERTFADLFDRENWRRTLHDGLLPGSAYTPETPSASAAELPGVANALFERLATRGGWEVNFTPSPTLLDGRFANNGWLQETPAPMTKLTWDNAVLVSARSARDLDVTDGDLVRVEMADGRAMEAPVLRVPGIADQTVTLALGGGRAFEGRICKGAGFDFGRLRSVAAMGIAPGASVSRARGSYPLGTTQDHHAIDVETVGGGGIQTRLPTLYREATLSEFESHPDFAQHRAHVLHRLSMWEEDNLEGATYAWAMTIDLNACVGCGACITACQAENNIPIVGKDQILRGREMHWLRVDRYFDFGTDADGHYDADQITSVALQPVVCMHCENAPCEQVCPVAATVHDEDGLNVMVYNRCVGTRYCSNNCPYKVRRFNYFDWHRREPYRESPLGPVHVDETYFARPQATPEAPLNLQFNPEVSVRMRGVMEKCTYCVHRIQDGKIQAKNAYARRTEEEKSRLKDRRVAVADGAITPACAQTCPAEAIVFGDLNDPNSRVAKLHKNVRAYEMLEELNVDARTKYLAKLRNPAGGGGAHETHEASAH